MRLQTSGVGGARSWWVEVAWAVTLSTFALWCTVDTYIGLGLARAVAWPAFGAAVFANLLTGRSAPWLSAASGAVLLIGADFLWRELVGAHSGESLDVQKSAAGAALALTLPFSALWLGTAALHWRCRRGPTPAEKA